jgi:hypothetical protein
MDRMRLVLVGFVVVMIAACRGFSSDSDCI